MTRISFPIAGIECPISGEYTEDIASTPCGHEFDTSHILEWINRSASGTAPCPICRGNVSIDLLTFDENTHSFSMAISIQETARKVILVLRSATRSSALYLENLVNDYMNNRGNVFSVLLLSWAPSAADAICLVNRVNQENLRGKKVVSLARYRALGEEFVAGLIAGTTLCAAELYRNDILSDPSSAPIVRKFYKISLDISRIAIIAGSPLIAMSNYGQFNHFRPIGASLIFGGSVATQAVVVAHTVKNHWRNSTSMGDFFNRITLAVLYVGFMVFLINNFAISVFQE